MRRYSTAIPQTSSMGVPQSVINYSDDVETWWDSHWNNPISANYIVAVHSPDNIIDVDLEYSGNLQAALNAAPIDGATFILGSGPYALAAVSGKYNLHFIGNGSTICRGIKIFGAEITETYFGNNNNGWVNAIWVGNTSAIAAATATIYRNYYFKDIVFDGNSVTVTVIDETPDNTALFFRGIRDILVDRCVFQNYNSSASSWHPGLISGNGMVQGLWARRCTFTGPSKYAFFCDGLHDGGVTLSTFSGTLAGPAVLNLCNNDFTYDYLYDGQMSGLDLRDPKYLAYTYNTLSLGSSNPSTCFNIVGGKAIIAKNIRTGTQTLSSFVTIQAHCYNPLGTMYLPGGAYESYSTIIKDNSIGAVTNGVTLDGTSGEDPSGVTTCTLGNYGKVGNCTVINNNASSISSWLNAVSPTYGINTVSNNTP